MEFLYDFILWQVENLVSIKNLVIFLTGIFIIYAVFWVIYKIQGMEYLNPIDRSTSLFEKEYLQKFSDYLGWAFIQQFIILIPLNYVQLPNPLKYILATVIFGCLFHFPNKRLMIFTTIFASMFYNVWFLQDSQSLAYITILHAFGGTAYYKLGWDMRVWRLK